MTEALERTDDDPGSASLYVPRPPTPDPRSLMPDTWLLISLRWQVAWNGFNSRKLSSKILTILVGLWFALVAVGISAVVGGGSGFFVRNLTDRHYDAIIPGAILTFIAVLLLFSSFGIAL